MDNTTQRFFISYASQDRRSAEILTGRLREQGAKVWIDHENIKLGDSIITRISEGLLASDVLLFLVSHASGASPWCRKEYESLLQQEILSGRTRVIPVVLDESPIPILLGGKRYFRFADLDESLTELLTGSPTEIAPPSIIFKSPSGVLDGLSLLLLLDQFPIGVWGRSLTPLAAAYDHPEDPGSITVSSWCADALRELHPAGEVPEIELFTKYILERRHIDSGAVGMRKQVGSSPFRDYTVLDNCRHAAVAALYLYKHCNSLDLALQSLRYVMESQTPRGAWVAVGRPKDENADPLTTGYVLGVLRAFERAGLLSAISIPERDLFLASYWRAGILWLYESLLRNGGWWSYRDESRTYCYTSDILMAVPEFWMENRDYEKAHENLVTRLFEIWKKNAVGIPSGPGLVTPHLETTAQYVTAIWHCRVRYPDLNAEAQRLFTDNLEALLDEGDSDAAGWALTIRHLAGNLGIKPSSDYDLPALRRIASSVEAQRSGTHELSSEYAALPRWVSSLAKERIFPIETRA